LTITRRAGIEHDHSIRVTLFTITLLNPVLAPRCAAAHHCPESVRPSRGQPGLPCQPKPSKMPNFRSKPAKPIEKHGGLGKLD